MILIGILHIILSLIAYILYFFITLKSFSKQINYSLIFIANILYVLSLIFGIIWAKIEWGFYLNFDIKTIFSIILPIPYVLENIIKTNKYYLSLVGIIIIILNYIVPLFLNTIHIH